MLGEGSSPKASGKPVLDTLEPVPASAWLVLSQYTMASNCLLLLSLSELYHDYKMLWLPLGSFEGNAQFVGVQPMFPHTIYTYHRTSCHS